MAGINIRRPSAATIMAGTALFLSLGGAAYAANGGTFKLGVGNTATATTKLTSNNNGGVMNLTQSNTGANATGLSVNVPSGHPPLKVNSNTQVSNLNSSLLGGLDSGAFSRLIALRTSNLVSAPIVAGNNYLLTPAWTPDVSGRCMVSVETQIRGTANTDIGPYFRVAIQQGGAPPTDDNFWGHYFQPDPSGFSDDMTRVSAVNVTGGVPVAFGAFLGSPAPDWVGDVADVHVTALCTTIGELSAASSASAAHRAAGSQQRQ
jgi:hypothetical protein